MVTCLNLTKIGPRVAVALLLAGFMAAPPVRAADKPDPAIDLATLPERAARNYPASQEPFEQILKLRATGDAAAVPALTQVMAADVLRGRIHGYAASQALFQIGTPEAHQELAKYLFDPRYRAASGIDYTFHWNMAEPARSRFIQQYHLVNLAQDLTLQLESRSLDQNRLEFEVTLKNVSDKPLQMPVEQAYFGNLLRFATAGRFVRQEMTAKNLEYNLGPPSWMTLAPGTTHTYKIEARIVKKGNTVALATHDVRFDIGQLGQFTVVAMVEHAPWTEQQLAAAKVVAGWSGRAVSRPLVIQLPPRLLTAELEAAKPAGHVIEVAAWFVNSTKEPQMYKHGLGMTNAKRGCTLTLTAPDGKQWAADAPPLPEHQNYKDIVVPPGGKVLIGRWDLSALRYSSKRVIGAGQLAFAELPQLARWQVEWWDGVFQLGSPLRSAPVEIVVGAQDTAASVVHLIAALASANQEERVKAADELRLILGRDPSAAPNRHERAFWEARLKRLPSGMTEEEAIQALLPDATPDERRQARGFDWWGVGVGTISYRLDDYWTVTLPLVGDLSNAKVSRDKAPVLTPSVRWFQLSQPANYTGTWTTYFANGQKAAEIQYRDGKPDGAFINYHDNGAKKIEQHYVGGVEHGLDTGWHPNGQKAYEGRYDNYKPVGTWRWWDATGKLTREEERGPAVETLERETTTIQHSKKQEDAPWGAAVEGVQVRLRAEKTVWAAGEVPELKVDARNNGDRKLVAPHGSLLFDVEVDGRWYSWSGPVSVQSTEFSAAKPREGIVVSLGLGWQPKDGNYTLSQLPLTPGKHIIRVAFQASPSGAELQKRELPDLRALSNPVEIEVQDPKTGRAAPNPAPLAHAAVLKELAAKADQIVLGQILKVHNYTARDGGMGYEVRVTKVIKGAATELPLRFRSAGWTGYARYAVDESVLLFLQSKQPAPNVPGEWGQLAPVVYLAKDPRPGGVSLWPVADYLPLLAEPRPAVPTTTAGKVELAPEEPWGEAVEGVQVRLRAEKDVWEVGEVELLADARCVGANRFIAAESHRGWEIMVNNIWYVWGEPSNEPMGVFDAEHPRQQIRLRLNQDWIRKIAPHTPLALGPGEHDIYVALIADPSNPPADRLVAPIRAVSRFVRVHVQKPLAKGETPVYVQVIALEPPAKDNVEPWIAKDLTARGEKQFRAATPWIRLTDEFTGLETGIGCPGGGQIVARKSGGDVIVEITGFTPEGRRVKLTVPDKPGACTIGVVDPGQNYVALRTGPPARVAQLQTQEDQTTAALKSHGFHYVVLSDEQKATLDAALGLLTLEKQTKAQSRLIDAAAVYLSEQINFAAGVERACTEYRGYFWFSRLDTAGQDDQTFASGFAIRKGTGDIYRWKNAKPRAPATDPDPKASKGNAAWSEVNDGLRGRLMIAQPKIAADGWLQATLELENVGKTPLIVFTGNPMLFKASVVDVAGKPVLPTNGRDVLMSPQRVVIEAGKRLSIPVTIESLDGAKGSQVDTTTRIWKLPPGQYTLGGTYGWDAIEEMPPRGTWLGRLTLPAVPFEVVAGPADVATPAAQRLAPFYRNGWHGWNPGTEVRTTFLDDKVEGWYSYVQPDLVYRLTEAALTRIQVVDGKPVVQQFDPANETGWQPAYLHKLPTAKATPTTIEIDGVKIDCLLYESTMDYIGRDVGGTTVLKEWVLAAHPSTWLRTEANKNYKVIKSLRELRQVGDRQVACVVVEERMEMSGGHQITTSWLSPEVPGHVVEKISQTWFEGRQQRSHERVAEMRSARGVSETKPGP